MISRSLVWAHVLPLQHRTNGRLLSIQNMSLLYSGGIGIEVNETADQFRVRTRVSQSNENGANDRLCRTKLNGQNWLVCPGQISWTKLIKSSIETDEFCPTICSLRSQRKFCQSVLHSNGNWLSGRVSKAANYLLSNIWASNTTATTLVRREPCTLPHVTQSR